MHFENRIKIMHFEEIKNNKILILFISLVGHAQENVFSERIWKAKVKAILENYQKKMVMAIKNGYDGGEENKRWSFAGAFLYSLTVITTIGEFTFLLHLSIRHLIKTFLSRCTSHSYSVFYNLVVRKNWIQRK